MNELADSRVLVLDANIILRAVLGTRVRNLIERHAEEVALFIPLSCVAEVREYLPALCAKRRWDAMAAANLLDTLLTLVRVVEPGFYTEFEEASKRRIAMRDVDDWPVVALALALGAGIWTEDSDFFGSGLATWTTETVEVYFTNDRWQTNEPSAPPYSELEFSPLDVPGVVLNVSTQDLVALVREYRASSRHYRAAIAAAPPPASWPRHASWLPL
jgi:predicted nucleic acid-binding protein